MIHQKKNEKAMSITSYFFWRLKNRLLHTYLVTGSWHTAHTVTQDFLHQTKHLLLKAFCIWLQSRTPPTFWSYFKNRTYLEHTFFTFLCFYVCLKLVENSHFRYSLFWFPVKFDGKMARNQWTFLPTSFMKTANF